MRFLPHPQTVILVLLRHTVKTPSDCFTLAANDCFWTGKAYGEWVVSTADYCLDKTEMSDSDCLAKAALGCKPGLGPPPGTMSGGMAPKYLNLLRY